MLFIIAQISINLLHSIIKIIFHYKERIGKEKSRNILVEMEEKPAMQYIRGKVEIIVETMLQGLIIK